MSKELELQLQEALRRIERLEAAQACRNLMGKYSYYHTAFRNKEYVELWANRDDCYYRFPFGEYRGIEAIRHCYLVEHGDRTDPGMDQRLKGMLMMHEMDTEVLEVAEDGQTAKGCWISPGHETVPAKNLKDGEEPHGDANWCWGKYEVESIKDNGQWKIWHMILYPLFKTSFYKSWGEPGAESLKPRAMNPMTGQRNPDYWVYDTDAVYPADEPEPPVPYQSYGDMPHRIVPDEA